jgi:hypothetical protein
VTQSAVAYRETESGNTTLSTGLRTHKGLLEATSMRIRGPLLYPGSTQGNGPSPGGGQGMELLHNTDVGSGIQSFDREKYAWLDFSINAKNINLVPQGGIVTMPAGSAQAMLGYYRATSGWTIPVAGQWIESAAQVNTTCRAGSVVRLEACGTVTMNTAQALMYFGFMRDGALYIDTQQCVQAAVANALTAFSFIGYDTSPLAGVHRYSIGCYLNAGTGGFYSGSYTNLYVTEQRA